MPRGRPLSSPSRATALRRRATATPSDARFADPFGVAVGRRRRDLRRRRRRCRSASARSRRTAASPRSPAASAASRTASAPRRGSTRRRDRDRRERHAVCRRHRQQRHPAHHAGRRGVDPRRRRRRRLSRRPGAQARFNGPIGVAVDGTGRVIVADTYNDRIRAIGRMARSRTLAGGAVTGLADGPAAEARFDTPCGVAIDARGDDSTSPTPATASIRVIDHRRASSRTRVVADRRRPAPSDRHRGRRPRRGLCHRRARPHPRADAPAATRGRWPDRDPGFRDGAGA